MGIFGHDMYCVQAKKTMNIQTAALKEHRNCLKQNYIQIMHNKMEYSPIFQKETAGIKEILPRI